MHKKNSVISHSEDCEICPNIFDKLDKLIRQQRQKEANDS